jgi:hypothetical protein
MLAFWGHWQFFSSMGYIVLIKSLRGDIVDIYIYIWTFFLLLWDNCIVGPWVGYNYFLFFYSSKNSLEVFVENKNYELLPGPIFHPLG